MTRTGHWSQDGDLEHHINASHDKTYTLRGYVYLRSLGIPPPPFWDRR